MSSRPRSGSALGAPSNSTARENWRSGGFSEIHRIPQNRPRPIDRLPPTVSRRSQRKKRARSLTRIDSDHLVDPADKLSWNRIVSETGFDITEEEWTPPKGIQPDPQQRRRSGPPSRGRHGGPRAGGSRGSGPRSGGSRSGGGGNRSKGGGPRKGPSGGGGSRNRRSRPER